MVAGTSYEVSSAGSIAKRTSVQFTLSTPSYGGVGINTTTPVTTLDVNGNIKVGFIDQPCTTAIVGSFRYNSSTDEVEVCKKNNGSPIWKVIPTP